MMKIAFLLLMVAVVASRLQRRPEAPIGMIETKDMTIEDPGIIHPVTDDIVEEEEEEEEVAVGGCPEALPKDCKGECGGTASLDVTGFCCYARQKDQCGVCFGKNKCLDCNRTPYGTASYDECDVCAGGTTGRLPNADKDCSGKCFGDAFLDDCEVCSGGTTFHIPESDRDCGGVCFGPNKLDECGECNGDGTSCLSCDGVPFSNAKVDVCGVCKGDNSTCCGAYGNCNNVGVCSSNNGGSCLCDFGWTGKFCTERQDACKNKNCGKHGRCDPTSGSCVCDEGFMGGSCQYTSCSGHGLPDPTRGGACLCNPGYAGSDCTVCGAPTLKGSVYVCVSKYGENVNERIIDEDATKRATSLDPTSQAVVKPIRFMLAAVPKKDLERVITGDHYLTRSSNKIAILPGTAINGTIYGCDCFPAIPVFDAFGEESGGEGGGEEEGGKQDKRMNDALEIRKYLSKHPISEKQKEANMASPQSGGGVIKRYLKFEPASGRNKKRGMITTKALTPTECGNLFNELFDFFDINIDALTGTAETVGEGVDQIIDDVNYLRISTVTYFSVVLAAVVISVVCGLACLLLVTGASLTGGFNKMSKVL
jgi:hypothetical protein